MGRLPADTGTQVVVIQPLQPRRVYAAGAAGVYRSDDAGQIWQPAGHGLPEGQIRTLALDPRESSRLYAATAQGELYVTDDGADSWRALSTGNASAR